MRVRISELGNDIIGLHVQVDVLPGQMRENTEEDYERQGEYGVVSVQPLNAIPVMVKLESGQERWFWRHSLVVADAFTCVSCNGVRRGTDYLCEDCREEEYG